MSLFFLHPIYLFGLIAAALPLVIHLLNRRKVNRIRFPAVRFILLSQKRISRSYRLRHWLLLALRTFAIILLALLLANPIFQTGAGLFAGSGPVSLALILDNSLSMTWSGDGIGFKQAKEAARVLISALNDGDQAAIIPTSATGLAPARLKGERDALLKELDAVEIADGSGNLVAAFSKAYELLSAPAGQKEIRFIGDLGLTDWDQFSVASLKQVDASIPVKAIRIDRKQTPINGTIKEIRAGAEGIGVDLPLSLEAVVANFGTQEIKDVLVQLSVDGRSKEQKLTSIPARGETAVRFQARLDKPGSHVGQVTLKKDGLAGNATLNFGLHAQDKLKILVVDGDPQTALVQSETFFLSRALSPSGDGESSTVAPTVIIPEALNATSLDSFGVVVLCNVATLPDSFVAKLPNYLSAGGGLLIFGGDRVQAENYNSKIGQFLGAPIRDKKVTTEAAAEKIGKIDLSHPALQILSDTILQESMKSARIWGYSRGGASAKATLVSLANGDPLVTDHAMGRGRIVFIATTADRDWNDLPLKTVYLPLIQSLTQYLAGGKRGILDSGINVGETKQIALPPSNVGKNLRIARPDKQEIQVSVRADGDHALASVEENDRSGIYRLAVPGTAGKDTATPELYAVNSPFLESRLDTISDSELQAKLKPVRVDVLSLEAVQRGGKRTDLAFPLLATLILTLLLEGWIAQRL